MDNITKLEEARELLNNLDARIQSASRLTKPEKYRMLKQVYRIRLTPEDHEKLAAFVRKVRMEEGANRSFIEGKSGQFTAPLRFLFPSIADRTNVSRYANALQYLLRKEVGVEDFANAVKKHGGITGLYWNERNHGKRVSTRNKLSLSTNITYTVGVPVTLTLTPQDNGVFVVQSMEQER